MHVNNRGYYRQTLANLSRGLEREIISRRDSRPSLSVSLRSSAENRLDRSIIRVRIQRRVFVIARKARHPRCPIRESCFPRVSREMKKPRRVRCVRNYSRARSRNLCSSTGEIDGSLLSSRTRRHETTQRTRLRRGALLAGHARVVFLARAAPIVNP